MMTLAGLDSYRLQPPEVITPAKSREIAEALNIAMPSLPHTRRDIAATEPLDETNAESRWKDASGYFGG
jgi:hypothetical protein